MRGGDGMSAEQPFSPAELIDLRIFRGRARMDRGDIEPMRRVTYAASPGRFDKVEQIIPWMEALNMEVA